MFTSLCKHLLLWNWFCHSECSTWPYRASSNHFSSELFSGLNYFPHWFLFRRKWNHCSDHLYWAPWLFISVSEQGYTQLALRHGRRWTGPWRASRCGLPGLGRFSLVPMLTPSVSCCAAPVPPFTPFICVHYWSNLSFNSIQEPPRRSSSLIFPFSCNTYHRVCMIQFVKLRKLTESHCVMYTGLYCFK